MAKAKKSKKLRQRFGRDALDWQERHSPTVEIAVDDPEAKRKTRRNLTRCRQSEAWRHNQLSGMQQEAAREMELAWRKGTLGLGGSISRYAPPLGRGNGRDVVGEVDENWRRWVKDARRRRPSIMVAAFIDCLAEPKTLAQVEQDRRMRRGQAMQNYVRGLDLWCEIRGWTRGPTMLDGPHLAPEGTTIA